MKSLCCLDDWTDLTCGKLKKGMIQSGAELAGADPSQISAVDGGGAVRMKLGLLDEKLCGSFCSRE